MLDAVAIRVFMTTVALVVGWVAGVYAYVALLYVFGDRPKPGDIHVGALGVGLAGMIGFGLAAWRWSGRFARRAELPTRSRGRAEGSVDQRGDGSPNMNR